MPGCCWGVHWGLSPWGAQEPWKLLLPSRLACARLCSALCWQWGWEELSAFCMVSGLSLAAVPCPSAREELSKRLLWGRLRMGYCLCLCGLEKSRSQLHIICFLAEIWAAGPRKQVYYLFCWCGDFYLCRPWNANPAESIWNLSLFPSSLLATGLWDLLCDGVAGSLALPCLHTNKDTCRSYNCL